MMSPNSPEAAALDAAQDLRNNFASGVGVGAPTQQQPSNDNAAVSAHIAAQSLLKLPEELQKIVDKPAFDLARLISPRYVEQDSFLLRFLIAENFDAKAAAARLVRHFQKKVELYGREKLGSAIQVRDLGMDDQLALASGGVQLLQAKDREGRPILLTSFSKMKYKTPSNMARALWFVVMTALEMRLVQKEGLVWVSFQMNDTEGSTNLHDRTMDHEVLKELASCAESLPVRLNSLHLCSNAIDRLMAPAIMLETIAKSNKIQMNFHHGAAETCMQKLSLFGIPESAFDVLRAPDGRAGAPEFTGMLPPKNNEQQQDVLSGTSNEGDGRKRSFDEQHNDHPEKRIKAEDAAVKVEQENEQLLRGGGGSAVPSRVPSIQPPPAQTSTVNFSSSEQNILRQHAALHPFHRGPTEQDANHQSSLAALVSLQQQQHQHQLNSPAQRQLLPTNAGDMRLPSSSSGGLLFGGGGVQGNNAGSHLSTSAIPPYLWASSGGGAQPHNINTGGNARSDPSLNMIQSYLASMNPSERSAVNNLPSSNLSQSASLEGLLGSARSGQQGTGSFFDRAHQQYAAASEQARNPHLPVNAINQLLGPNASGLNRYDTPGQQADMNAFLRQQLLSRNLAASNQQQQEQRFLPQRMQQQEAKSQADAMRSPVRLYSKSDDVTLSPYQCLVRQQMELFEASEDDVQFNISKMSKAIAVGQVGLRCRHCAVLPPFARPKAAVYYPRTLDSLYQFGQNMVKNHHCGSCMKIDEDTKNKLLHLQEERRRGKGGRERWAEAARAMGVVEGQRGLRFTR